MPGHKGKPSLGCEPYDVTEIQGLQDQSLIYASEENASRLFATAHSFYSAEGSTLAIKAMLYLAVTVSKEKKKLVLAARNAHKAFLYAAAWLDFEIKWLFPEETSHICACPITKESVDEALSRCDRKPAAVYLTSPDYLGHILDIRGIAAIAKKHGVPLLVDNAHGAYLRFLPNDLHPISLGATMTADSAHKTLPVLTGGAYLHIAKGTDRYFVDNARIALDSFASTSPSFLTLSSLDLCNAYLEDEGIEAFGRLCKRVRRLKRVLVDKGITLLGEEPMKLTVVASDHGVSGNTLADRLRREGVECEFSDEDYTVFMLSPQNSEEELNTLEQGLIKALDAYRPGRDSLEVTPLVPPPVAMTPREAMLSAQETLPVEEALGRIAASPTVSCPPAVPIVVSGEIITEEALRLFKRYQIKTVAVVRKVGRADQP